MYVDRNYSIECLLKVIACLVVFFFSLSFFCCSHKVAVVIYTEEIRNTIRSNQETWKGSILLNIQTTFLVLSQNCHLIVNVLNVKGPDRSWIKVENFQLWRLKEIKYPILLTFLMHSLNFPLCHLVFVFILSPLQV